tara:strand:- start:1019 stop:1939 length:921 start_codon:yes stop_codon:yes gene_type:complete
MINVFNQKSLFGLSYYFDELRKLYDDQKFPNKIILSGPKGIGKFTLSLHLINYVLSKDEDNNYDLKNYKINENNKSFKLILNKSSPNFYLIDIQKDKKNIDINQIRDLINFCNKSSFNNKPRFILINDIELMNLNSNNSLLKTLEEPNKNINFILINSSNKVLPTIRSRCLNFKISLCQNKCIEIFEKITNQKIESLINKNLISHYFTTGDLLDLYNFSKENDINLQDISLKNFLLVIIDNNYYKKENFNLNLIYALVQMYFIQNFKYTNNINFYSKFIESIDNIKRFNLDIESLFIQLRNQLKND